MERAAAIDVVKKLFIAETCKAQSTAAALTTVLFDHAAHATAADNGFTRDELTIAVSAVTEHWGLGPVYNDTVHRELSRLPARLRAFTSKHLPLVGITAISGPTGIQRGDGEARLFLRIVFAPPAEVATGALDGAVGAAVEHVIGPQAKREYDTSIADGTAHVVVTEPVRNPTGRGVMMTVFISFLMTMTLLAYPPSRRWIQQTAQRFITGQRPADPTPAGKTVVVRPDPAYDIFNLRVNNRETLLFAGTTSSMHEGTCTNGKAEVRLHFAPLPALKELVLLRNDEIYKKYPNYPGGRFDEIDREVQPKRAYVYKLAHFDPATGEYLTSRGIGVFTPKCATDNRRPIGLSMSVEPQQGVAPLSVRCSVSATDPDGDRLTYHWAFMETGPARFVEQRGASTDYTFKYGGKWTVKAYADDGQEEPHEIGRVDVEVDGPKPPIGTPAEWVRRAGFGEVEPATGPPGTPFRFRVLRQKNERGARAVQYRFRLGYCSPWKQPPVLPCVTPPQSSPEYVHTYPNGRGEYEVEAEITFDNGEMEVWRIAVVRVESDSVARPNEQSEADK